MRARLPATNMMVFFQAGQDRHFQGVVDQAEPTDDGVQVTADFPRANCPILPLGSEVALGFHSPYLKEVVWAPSTVVFRREEQFRHRYRFLFSEASEALVQPVVNCRRSARVQPASEEPLPVQVKSVDGRFEIAGELNDVSATGMSVFVPLEGEAQLFQIWNVQVNFRLPGVQHPFQFVGGICYRRLLGDRVHYGVDFHPDACLNFEHQHNQLNAFLNSGLAQESPDQREWAQKRAS